MAITRRNLWSLYTVVDSWADDTRGVTCQDMVDMVDTRHSNHFVALPSPYFTIDSERRRLIVSEILYGIV